MIFHVVLEGNNGFQKEEEREFEYDIPPPQLRVREWPPLDYAVSLIYDPIKDNALRVKDRTFRLRCKFYALGKYIAYYIEER